jgi:hypothetical protein
MYYCRSKVFLDYKENQAKLIRTKAGYLGLWILMVGLFIGLLTQ